MPISTVAYLLNTESGLNSYCTSNLIIPFMPVLILRGSINGRELTYDREITTIWLVIFQVIVYQNCLNS